MVAHILAVDARLANAVTKTGWTPLHYAAHGNSKAFSLIFAANPALIDEVTNKSLTALDLAIENHCESVWCFEF